MSLGFGFLLVGPLFIFNRELERRTEHEIAQVRTELTGEIVALKRSIGKTQESVTSQLAERTAGFRSRIQAMINDSSYEAVRDALEAAEEYGVLSPLGVRADAIATEFFVRLQLQPDQLVLHIDTSHQPSVLSADWKPGVSLDEVLVELADLARGTHLWPGDNRWEFESAFNKMVDTLLMGVHLHASGEHQANSVQLVDDLWVLSDWDAWGIGHGYQITYRRLDELDWQDQLGGKEWARDSAGVMLAHAEFLRDLAADVLGWSSETED